MPAPQLFATTSAEEHWQAVAGPWLRAQAASAWKETRPVVVLTPGRADGFYLRSRLVAEGTPLLGVRFWTPSDARKFLLAHYRPALGVATQAELRLVTRACAERLAAGDDSANVSLRSVVREPAAFLRAYDLLLGAGWNPARDGADYGRVLAHELQRELEKNGIATQAGLHRQLLLEANASPRPLIANLLVSGFNAAHWPLWDLLKAATLSAENAVIALSQPSVFAQGVDQLWISSWEDFAGAEAIVPDTSTPSVRSEFSMLAASYEKGARDPLPDVDLTFCVAPDLAAQSRAIVLRALDFLRRDDCTRVGIVFPEANALALSVSEELQRLGLPMTDGPGVLTPGIFERRSWQTWLALQEDSGTLCLIAWLRACRAEERSFGAAPRLTAEAIANLLEGALGETLVDDLAFLAGHLETQTTREHADDVAAFLRARIALPASATFARFLELTREALGLRGWEPLFAEFDADPPDWLRKGKTEISRRTFLEWLRETTDSQSRTRGSQSNHFYGKVHLLVYGQLSGQNWSHLILTGLNEGVWPRAFEAGAFGSRHELDALNQRARTLNQRVKIQGPHGEGQEVVGKGFSHCLLPLERQDLALRDLCAALESTTHAVCLAALTGEAGRSLLPSDFFNHAYHAKTSAVLDEETFGRMANATQLWCEQHGDLFDGKSENATPPLENLRAVHATRRDATQPFGPYEFAYPEPPARPIQLWCKRWEDAWNHPAQVWLESVVGAAPWPEGELSWPRAVGTWAHDWLAHALRDYRDHGPAPLLPLVREAAERTARRIREGTAAAEIALYPWWEQVWSQARSIAIGLAENLEPILRERHFETEYRIPSGLVAALPGSAHADFALKGRLDLLLFKPGAAQIDPTAAHFAGTPCWIVDFKTGAAKALSATDVAKGRGLQSLLYALAMRTLGAGATSISLLTRNAALEPQLDLDHALQAAALFQSLEIMHRAGIFGMRPDAENDYGFAPAYPLATRSIRRHILEAKWARTHGGVPGEEDDDA
jgi:hypothetical protein